MKIKDKKTRKIMEKFMLNLKRELNLVILFILLVAFSALLIPSLILYSVMKAIK